MNEIPTNCKLHPFCNQTYEFNEYSDQYQSLQQPHSAFNGEELPSPLRFQNVRKFVQNMSVQDITEEALDDWIAQSSNRPIISFMDPYKKFKAPDSLITKLRKRHAKLLEQKDVDIQRKLLYFEDRKEYVEIPHYMIPIRQGQEMQKDVTFKYDLLKPNLINGTKIIQREDHAYNHYKYKHQISVISNTNPVSSYNSTMKKSLFQNNQLHKKSASTDRQHRGKFTDKYEDQQIVQSVKRERTGTAKTINNYYTSKFRVTDIIDNKHNKNKTMYQDKSTNEDKLFRENSQMIKLKPIQVSQIDQKLQQQKQFQNYLQQPPIESQANLGQQGQNKKVQTSQKSKRSFTVMTSRQAQRVDLDDLYNKQVEELMREEQDYIKKIQIVAIDIHLDFIFDKNSSEKDKNKMNDVDFSFYRSQRRLMNFQYREAIQSCKQTIQLDNKHFNSIFNLANIYERLKCYQLAIKWFKIAKQIKPQDEIVTFGIGICFYKSGQPGEALVFLNDLAENAINLDNKVMKWNKRDKIYLRALCNKQKGDLVQASEDYIHFYKLCTPVNYQLLKNLMISVLFKNKRGLEVEVEQNVLSDFIILITQITNAFAFENPISIHSPNMENIYEQMNEIPLFQRFEKEQVMNFIQVGKFEMIEQEQLVYNEPDIIKIVLSGTLLVIDHSDSFDQPEIISYYSSGDIMGASELDNNISKKTGIWFQVTSHKVQLIKIPKKIFKEEWKNIQNGEKKNNLIQFLQELDIFKGISEITINKLCYEYFEFVDFRQGDLIFSSLEYKKMDTKIQLKKVDEVKKEKSRLTLLQNNLEKPKLKGIYIIRSGIAELQTDSGWLEYKIQTGDVIGENLLFKTESVSQLGKIRAKSDYVRCIHLPKQSFIRINQIDKNIMQQNILKSSKYQDVIQMINKYFQEHHFNNKNTQQETQIDQQSTLNH